MSERAPEGFHSGTIEQADFAMREGDPDTLAAWFYIKLDTGEYVEARHRLFGDKADKNADICKSVGINVHSSEARQQMHAAEGKRVRVNVRWNDKYTNAYIVLPGGAKANEAEINAALSKLAGENAPF